MSRAPHLSRMALVAFAWVAGWVAVVTVAALVCSRAEAMTVADVPAIPANAVEVCDHYHAVMCPLVTLPAPLNVSTPNTIEGLPALEGAIVRFEPINGEQGAWVRIVRTGGQLWFPLRDLTLLGGAR